MTSWSLRVIIFFYVVGTLFITAHAYYVDPAEQKCLKDRVECGSKMAESYGLDVWRFDLLTTLNFTVLLTAIHSNAVFRQLCSDYSELLSCLSSRPAVCKASPWYGRVVDTVRSMRLHSACLEGSLRSLKVIESCWHSSSAIISAQQSCLNQLKMDLNIIDLMTKSIGTKTHTYQIDDTVTATRNNMCRKVDTFLKCITEATRSECEQAAVDWEKERLNGFTDKLYSNNNCYIILGVNVLTNLIIVILCLIGLGLFAIIAYIAFIRYKFSVLLPRQQKERLARLQLATRKIFKPNEELKHSFKKRHHVHKHDHTENDLK